MQNMNLRFDQMINATGINSGSRAFSLGETSNKNSLNASSSVKNDSSFLIALENARKQLDSVKQSNHEISESKNNSVKAEKVKSVKTEKIDSEVKTLTEKSEVVSTDLSENSDFDAEKLGFSFEELVDFVEKNSEQVELAEDGSVILDDKVFAENSLDEILSLSDEKSEIQKNFSDMELLNVNISEKSEAVSEKELSEIAIQEDELSKIELSDEEIEILANFSANEVAENVKNETLSTQVSNLEGNNSNDLLENISSDNEKIQKKTKNPVFSVSDERTDVNQVSSNSSSSRTKENFVTSVEKTGQGQVEMTMNLANSAQNGVTFEGTANPAFQQTDSSQFSRLLSQQLQQSSSDFVKAGSIVLKDGGKGTINLVMHPEELGNVRIQLELTDKVVSGKIVVATKEAFDAFNQNLNNLKNAFAQAGFDGANFDLSWSGQQQQNQNDGQRNFYANVYQDNVKEVFDSTEVEYESYLAHEALMYGSSMIDIIA